MAKKSVVQRQIIRLKLILKYKSKRADLKNLIKLSDNQENVEIFTKKLQALPRNSSPTRSRNRCSITGRSRGYFRFFGLCRTSLREFIHEGCIPGVKKSSW